MQPSPVLVIDETNNRGFLKFYYRLIIDNALYTNTTFQVTNAVSKLHRTGNVTSVSEFFLTGLSDDPELQPLLFILFLSLYLVTVLGNLLIILAVTSDPHLHTPMYFFLSNLSLVDISFISTTVPKMIVNIQTHSRVISYEACLTQMSFFILFVCMDGMLLTAMAYDSLLDSQVHNLTVLQVACFKNVEISNFFCDPSQLLKLACSDTFTNNIVTYGPFDPLLSDKGQFPSLYLMASKDSSLIHGMIRILLHFDWTWVAAFFSEVGKGNTNENTSSEAWVQGRRPARRLNPEPRNAPLSAAARHRKLKSLATARDRKRKRRAVLRKESRGGSLRCV
eukprot:bmy_11756T0